MGTTTEAPAVSGFSRTGPVRVPRVSSQWASGVRPVGFPTVVSFVNPDTDSDSWTDPSPGVPEVRRLFPSLLRTTTSNLSAPGTPYLRTYGDSVQYTFVPSVVGRGDGYPLTPALVQDVPTSPTGPLAVGPRTSSLGSG